MGVLLVLPLAIHAPSPEVSAASKKQMEEFNSKILGELASLSPQLTQTTEFGAHKGLKKYTITGIQDLVLQPTFLFVTGPKSTQHLVGKFVTLSKQSQCQVMGVFWESGSGINGLALPDDSKDSSKKLSEIAVRTFENKTPVYLNTELSRLSKAPSVPLIWQRTVPSVAQWVVTEQLAAAGIVVIDEASRPFCGQDKFVPPDKLISKQVQNPVPSPNPSSGQNQTAEKPHRLVKISLEVQAPKDQITLKSQVQVKVWPKVKVTAQMWGGVVGEKQQPLLKESSIDTFAPVDLGKKLASALANQTVSLEAQTFEVSRRFGKWAYINRGRAFGLRIGMHLVGPRGAKLHVIQWLGDLGIDPLRKGEEGVALVRKESQDEPLKAGDVLQIDPAAFPAAALEGSRP